MNTTITIEKGFQGWTAVFGGNTDMPKGVSLPLPFTNAASAKIVRDDLRSRFPGATFITKANSRDAEVQS